MPARGWSIRWRGKGLFVSEKGLTAANVGGGEGGPPPAVQQAVLAGRSAGMSDEEIGKQFEASLSAAAVRK